MGISETIKQQWSDIGVIHSSRLNLIIHVFAVPTFIIGIVGLIYSLANLRIIEIGGFVLMMAFSLLVQSYGHSRENVRSAPFAGPMDALTRILIEQLINFPRFVMTGKWFAALGSSKA